jgi:HEPN domain-containing protein
MRPDDARAGEAREWFGKAAEDIESSRALVASGHFANALFFCQQAAEKSLKGFLTWHERTFRRTHDLEELGSACGAIDNSLAALVEEADVLSEYAWKLRYPGAPYLPNREEAESMLALAVRVFQEVQSRLPLEARTR